MDLCQRLCDWLWKTLWVVQRTAQQQDFTPFYSLPSSSSPAWVFRSLSTFRIAPNMNSFLTPDLSSWLECFPPDGEFPRSPYVKKKKSPYVISFENNHLNWYDDLWIPVTLFSVLIGGRLPWSRVDRIAVSAWVQLRSGPMQMLLPAGEGSSSSALVIPIAFRISSSNSSSIHVDTTPDQRL